MIHCKGLYLSKNKKLATLESDQKTNYKQIVNILNKTGKRQKDLEHKQVDKRVFVVFHLRLLMCIPVFNYLRRCDIPLRESRRSEVMAVSCLCLLIVLWNWFSRNSLNCKRVWGQTVTTASNHWVKIVMQSNNEKLWWNKEFQMDV